MSHVYPSAQPADRPRLREWLVWLWLVGLLLLVSMTAIAFGRTFSPPATTLFLGQRTDFPPGMPVLIQPRRDLRVFVMRMEDEVYVWDRLPARSSACAPLVWVAHEHRFIDPCSAGKWCADGAIADPRIAGIRPLTGYRAVVDSAGLVSITLSERVGGQSSAGRKSVPRDPAWLPPDEVYYCQHLR